MTNYTDINIILDRSGSMEQIKEATISSINEFINAQKLVPGDATLSLYQFDDKYDTVYENRPLQQASHLSNETFVPRGWTALYDAICTTIDSVGARLSKMTESDRPKKVLVVVMTDGHENMSKKFSKYDVASKIKHQQDKYSWQFVFLGANQDAIATADSLGFDKGSALTYQFSNAGVKRGTTQLCAATANYRMSHEKTNDFFGNN